jgi:hypothetical protein
MVLATGGDSSAIKEVLKMEICLHALNPTGMSMHATGPIFRHPLVKTLTIHIIEGIVWSFILINLCTFFFCVYEIGQSLGQCTL